MTLFPIIVSIFAGFAAGYAARAWRSHRRRERHPLHRSYGPTMSRQNPSFARVRRAF
ncbi:MULTISPECIES: hypothetical protein [unclassified Bradyrhizobium]|uniref:hypothetical protein n=1 Tax=unclassified Bradyrhizobium TaxID=2631580 RepID=UPI002478B0A1|nr:MULTISPECIES: hypothetical protein [unclassified Bradyrhizobium]WGR73495.1 hypothetical protein MTX24_12045 [Bradyrhizobium sp. ISRA426]WGR78332.1 hypothetical protein MTX21_37015 [Bradyrhizobium sp. ISRA430]WGR88733.1 hypothetical protein MTX25_12055 [Bradyrhizobium sp. ISRA432]